MKKLLALLMVLSLIGCSSKAPVNNETTQPNGEENQEVVTNDKIPDGVYRGGFTDPKQVEVEFEMKDNKFVSFKFRALSFKDQNYLKTEDSTIATIGKQYVDLGDYLVGKDFSAIEDLYTPANITSDIDGFSAATIRSGKVISAVNDAISRNPYKMTDTTEIALGTYPDGIYRGGYLDSTQVQVEFVLKNNAFESFKLRTLSYKGTDYLKSEDAAMKGIAQQYNDCVEYLVGKDVSAILDLYSPANVAKDVDGFSSATLRSGKMISAIFDGLSRGVYKLSDTSVVDYNKNYEDGTYRGAYLNAAEVEVEFVLKNNVIESIKFRALGYKGSNYLKSEVKAEQDLASQYQTALDYMAGKNISELSNLYSPGEIVEDVDSFSGATIRSSKIIFAINDGLSRGVYKK